MFIQEEKPARDFGVWSSFFENPENTEEKVSPGEKTGKNTRKNFSRP